MNEGIVYIKVIPLGGEKTFLKADENKDFKTLLKDSQKFFQQQFNIVREWETRDVGVPDLHASKFTGFLFMLGEGKPFCYCLFPLVD